MVRERGAEFVNEVCVENFSYCTFLKSEQKGQRTG